LNSRHGRQTLGDADDRGSELPLNSTRASSDEAPVRHDEEWANALSHGVAAIAAVLLGVWLIADALDQSAGLALACGLYIASVFATFSFSSLSHAILRQPLLNTLRAWDQAMIYAMISGTYTPIIYRYAPEGIRTPLLVAIWIAALAGMSGKLLMKHRVNNVATVSYLLLGWLPAIPLYGQVPSMLGWLMLLGGVLYSLGVVVLINDSKIKYLHVLWHVFVMSAAFCHFYAITRYVVG
jgi:hemolysin III